MRLRITASLLTLLCSWVMWEKAIFHGGGKDRSVEAVFEAKSLSDCRAAFPDIVKQRETGLKTNWKEPKYSVIAYERGVTVTSLKDGQTVQEYQFYCLPDTLDPSHHPG